MKLWKELDAEKLTDLGPELSDEEWSLSAVYGLEGKRWPRLIVEINYEDDGFKLSCAEKKKRNSFWNKCRIPWELNDDVKLLVELAMVSHMNRD